MRFFEQMLSNRQTSYFCSFFSYPIFLHKSYLVVIHNILNIILKVNKLLALGKNINQQPWINHRCFWVTFPSDLNINISVHVPCHLLAFILLSFHSVGNNKTMNMHCLWERYGIQYNSYNNSQFICYWTSLLEFGCKILKKIHMFYPRVFRRHKINKRSNFGKY